MKITVSEWSHRNNLSANRALSKRDDFLPPVEEVKIAGRTFYMVEESAALPRFKPWGKRQLALTH